MGVKSHHNALYPVASRDRRLSRRARAANQARAESHFLIAMNFLAGGLYLGHPAGLQFEAPKKGRLPGYDGDAHLRNGVSWLLI